MIVQEILRELRETIGGESAALDASLLTAAQLGIRREQIYTEPDISLSENQLRAIRQLAARRASGEPIAYLLGGKEFYGRDFRVDHRALIPRPDTEILVEAALQAIDQRSTGTTSPLRVLDLCSGSGCVGITLAAERPSIELVLTDIDRQALKLAAENAALILPPQRQPLCVVSDLLTDVKGRYDIVVANPPYVSTHEYTARGMTRWQEPLHALVAADNGLEVIRRIVDTVVGYMHPNGYFALEAADHQAEMVADLLAQTALFEINHVSDLAGKRRVTTAILPG